MNKTTVQTAVLDLMTVTFCSQKDQTKLYSFNEGTLGSWRRRGQQTKCWMDTIKEWASLPMIDCAQEGPLLNRPSCPPDDSIGHGTELN